MKPKLTDDEQEKIRRAKQILRHLWDQSGLKQTHILEALESQGLPIKKTTFSMWLSAKENNAVRPKEEYLWPLIRLFCAEKKPAELQEIHDELHALLGYSSGPLNSETLQNRVNQQLNESLARTISENQASLSQQISILDDLLDEIEPKILEYDKGFPVIFVEAEDRQLMKQLVGKPVALHKAFEVEGGYEVPLTQVQSLDVITEILNLLNEGIRLLGAYIERVILEEGHLGYEVPRMEDFVAYTWEISDRLLNNNLLCKSVPVLKRTLLRVMATAWGIRYIMQNQTKEVSDIIFQNILSLKGKTSSADIHCSVAVYMGVLVRQFIKTRAPLKVERGIKLFKKATQMLEQNHEKLNTEQEIFFYKKELANLHYDTASLLLWFQADDQIKKLCELSMKKAYRYYTEVLETVNLFYQGLTESRAMHIRAFHLISLCWSTRQLNAGVAEINKLSAGQQLNENFWLLHIAKAIAYSVLWYRSESTTEKGSYLSAAYNFLQKALLVPGYEAATQKELQTDFILKQAFPQGL